MSYIGRGTESISNVEVLDNLTFNGSASYTLQKSSVNFVPSSANNLLISISGVVQQGNFSVSGSTITFDTTVSASDTCDWILHYGTGLITTVADGAITEAKLGSNAVTTAKINNGAVSYAKTDGNFGKIGQVVQGTLTSTFASSNEPTSPVDIGLSATITPSSTSSKILCLVHIGLVSHSANSTWSFFLLRGSTKIGIGDASSTRVRANAGAGMEYNTSGWAGQNMAFNWLDSPATTSATTYKVQTGGNGTATIRINYNNRDQTTSGDEDQRTASTITLMEVLA